MFNGAPRALVTPPPYRGPVDHYANAIRAEPGRCWRMVSRGPGYRMGSPTDWPEPVQWIGRAVVGRKRMKLWSSEGRAEGLDDLRRLKLSNLRS